MRTTHRLSFRLAAARIVCALLALFIVLGSHPLYARAATAKDVLSQLDALEQASPQPGDAGYARFLQAIAGAYGVKDAAQLRGRVFVAYISSADLSAPPRFYVFTTPTEHHSAASALKVVLLSALARTVDMGQASWSDKRGKLTLSEHARRMVRQSNNESANAIMDVFSIQGVNDWLARLGFSTAEIEFQRHFSGSAKPGGPDNFATAAALAKFYFLLAQESAVDGMPARGAAGKARAMLSSAGSVNTDPHFNDRLNGKFPAGVEFVHKTGSNAVVIGDGGIVYDNGGAFIITAFDLKQDRAAMARLGLALLKLHRAAK
jgi:beta-lactamase class A